MTYIIAFYFAFALSTLFVPLSMRLGMRIGVLDQPNGRKVHSRPIPRTGGLAMAGATFIPLLVMIQSPFLWGYAAGGLCIVIFGLIDDATNLNYRFKLLGQAGAALLFILISKIQIVSLGELLPGITVATGYLAIPLSLVFFIAVINIINLSDGLDSLAAGLSLLILISCGLLALQQENTLELILVVVLLGSLAGFLRFNLHPARVFMGDTGSQFLGFSLAAILMSLTQGNSIYSPVLPLFLLGIPIIDTAMVIYERRAAGQAIFCPDKRHLHHKCLQFGLSQEQSVILIYTLQVLSILLGWVLRFSPDLTLLLLFSGITGLALGIRYTNVHKSQWLQGIFRFLLVRLKEVKTQFNLNFNRSFFSKVSWKSFFLFFGSFYAICPFYLKQISMWEGLFSLGLLLFTLLGVLILKKKQDALLNLVFVVLTLYVLYQFNQHPIQLHILGKRMDLSLAIILCIVCLNGLCLVLTPEKSPMDALDHLLLGLAVLIFFIPADLDWAVPAKDIILKAILLGMATKLTFSRIERNRRFVLGLIVYTLSMIGMSAFLA